MLVKVRVTANSRQTRVEEGADGSLKAWLKAKPVEGKANAELVKLLAAHFGVSTAAVRIIRGAGSRDKLVQVALP